MLAGVMIRLFSNTSYCYSEIVFFYELLIIFLRTLLTQMAVFGKSHLHSVKNVQIRSSGLYFLVFGLNKNIYTVNLHIQSEYEKTQTRKNSAFRNFSPSISRVDMTFSLVNGISAVVIFQHACYSVTCAQFKTDYSPL